jgi:hypothetical protein
MQVKDIHEDTSFDEGIMILKMVHCRIEENASTKVTSKTIFLCLT